MRVKENLLGTAYNRLSATRSSQRIAIVGSQASGKTVFLTSLISHLKHHDPKAMNLGQGVEILKCEEVGGSLSLAKFPYEYNRSTLVHDNTWPAKTTDASVIKLELKLKKGRKRPEQVILEFMDFPGERAVDFQMFTRSYEEWSDMVLDSIQADCCYAELAREFNALSENITDEKEVTYAYKKFLGNALTQRYSRIITPSVFLIDCEGTRPDADGTPDIWCRERFCGLSAAEEFVPLSKPSRLNNKKLAAKFADRYRKYKRKVVTPLVKWLSDADQMFILLDTPQILAGGSSMYNDEQAIAEQVIELCDYKKGFWHDLFQVGFLGWLLCKPSRIRQVGIVATKSDMVATNDDIDNMESLIRQMTYKKLRGISADKFDFFTCSTVVSTEPVGGRPPRLRGRLVYNAQGEKISESSSEIVEFTPSRMPEFWPNDDEWDNYSFPDVYPQVSARRDTPPRQEGLERIVKFILGL